MYLLHATVLYALHSQVDDRVVKMDVCVCVGAACLKQKPNSEAFSPRANYTD
jgi:hypothetical protein